MLIARSSEQSERGAAKGRRMAMCWKRSENHVEEAPCTDGGPVASPRPCCPHKALWAGLSASLLLIVLVLALTWHIRPSQPSSQSLQVVRIAVPDEVGIIINQSAVVDQQNRMVTFSVASAANQRSTVVFDIKHGLICYKPVHQDSCFLRKMEQSDYDNVHSLLQEHKSQFQLSANATQRQTEFLGVLAAGRVEATTLEKPLQALCHDSSIHWTRVAKGPGKPRLVYFCIDICFPSNVSASKATSSQPFQFLFVLPTEEMETGCHGYHQSPVVTLVMGNAL